MSPLGVLLKTSLGEFSLEGINGCDLEDIIARVWS